MSYPGAIHTIEGFEDVMFETACRQFGTCTSAECPASKPMLLLLAGTGADTQSTPFKIMTFVLDREFRIESSSAQMGFHPISVCKMRFSELVAAESKPLWSGLETKIAAAHNGLAGTFQITFLSAGKTLQPGLCGISRLGNSGRAVVHLVLAGDGKLIAESDAIRPLATQELDRLEKLYHYIIENLERPLPRIHELAKRFGTNNTTLKAGFRKVFGTGIYQFYIAERLKRAHLHIEQSTIPLHVIAADLGFGTYGNFTKAFRKKYGYVPSKVKRYGNPGANKNMSL